MGQAASDLAAETSTEVQELLTVLQNRRNAMLSQDRLARGSAQTLSATEVAGGRTVMRTSSIRVAKGTSLDDELTGAITDFFNSAQGAISGDKQSAKHSAVNGAKRLLMGGLSTLLGVSSGQSQEQQSFVVLFMNNAFVRVDYYAYSFSVSASKFGVEAKQSGACYVADMAVLDPQTLTPSEIDFLLSQAFDVHDEDVSYVDTIKMNLVESAVLSRMMSDPLISFSDLSKIAKSLASTHASIESAYKSMKVSEALA